ncbi:copper amine oxidase N-terminal domain-containing protein [Paenibacillus aurantiacus]|uniref:Copper amine oxidase N-terminal domain-containing protein n=1 Tax=Paenibacillus aurantiacus TaxID=1936118 RepID=A0ABV5KLR7_9BACL
MASEEILPKRSRFPKPRRTVSIRASKRMLAGFVSGSLVFAAVAVAFMYFIDPLQFYHKSWYTPVFSNEQRYQNPGLARNYDYDTIILGSSMTENFLPAVVDEELGGKTLKLSIRGSYAQEQNDIAQVAFATGKVKQVLWGLDYFALKPADLDAQGPYPHYLYDDKFWNDYKYWFNVTPYRELAEGLYKRSSATENTKRLMGLEYLYNWNYYVTYGKKYAMKTYQKALTDEAGFGNNEEPLEVVQNNFTTYVESVIKAHPETEFYIYYPPYSILRQAVWRDLNIPRYEQQLTMKKWMYDRFKQYPNVKVYDFQTEAEWTFNLDLFKDLSHHNMNVNTWITRAIGADDPKYRVTDANVDQFVTDLREQVEDVAVNAAGDLLRVPVRLADNPSKTVTFSAKVLRGQTNELLVPGKEAASVLGAEMTYDAATKTLTIVRGDRNLIITAGQKEATLNGASIAVATPVEIVGGRSMVPLVFLAETLGWKAETTETNAMTRTITLQQ